MASEFERIWVRRRFQPILPKDGGTEDVARTPTGKFPFEYLSIVGAVEELPSHAECRRLVIDFMHREAYSQDEIDALAMTDDEYAAAIEREQKHADWFAHRPHQNGE